MAAYPQPAASVPANASADTGAGTPRPQPSGQAVRGTKSGPTPQELRAAWRAYEGLFNAENERSDGPLTPQVGVPDLNVLSNRIKPIVNTGVDFLFGPSLTIAADDEVAQKIIDATWGDDDLRMTLLSKSGVNGGVYGHVFFKVVPPKRGKPSVLNPPRLVLLNPETLSIETDPDDADLVVRFCIEYLTKDDMGNDMRCRQTITRIDPDGDDADSGPDGLDADTTWEIQNFVAKGAAGNNWQPDGAPLPWPYQLPPIADWQNYPAPNSHWGQRDVTDTLVALNRQLRLVESNINKIGFLQGHPYVYSIGTNTGGVKLTPGQILDLEGDDAKLQALDAAGNLEQLMAFADAIRSDMDEESGIPGLALGRMKDIPRGTLSGIAMRLLNASALARTEHKRRLYGQGIRQVCQTALMVCGYDMQKAQDVEIKLTWQDPLPSDDLAEAQAAQTKMAFGYSNYTLIEETGGNPELEQERKQQEQQDSMTAFAHGTGTPPMDPNVLAASAQMGNDQQQQQGEEPQQPSPSSNGGGAPPINHPAAIAQRAKMAATAKG